MSGCCVVKEQGIPPHCPVNGQICKPVGHRTLESLLKPDVKLSLTNHPYYFCDAWDCDVVYVSALGDHWFTKDHLVVRVGVKETEEPIPLCYCFGFDRKAIREDIKTKGKTDIPQMISARVKAGECHCEETNPSGGCCLGSIYKTIQQAESLKSLGKL
jgi:hypothetical protein